MRQFVVVLTLVVGYFSQAEAQSFLDDVRSKKTGEGTVTVTQSSEIDELVNDAKLVKSTPAAGNAKPTTGSDAAGTSATSTQRPTRPSSSDDLATESRQSAGDNSSYESSSIVNTKKVMANSKKVTGYRVQAFSGGNSREDKRKAETIGNSIKVRYPSLPVYVHFHSPRWICRVGNFRTYQEAEAVLKEIKGMGYQQACIVKGKITVGY